MIAAPHRVRTRHCFTLSTPHSTFSGPLLVLSFLVLLLPLASIVKVKNNFDLKNLTPRMSCRRQWERGWFCTTTSILLTLQLMTGVSALSPAAAMKGIVLMREKMRAIPLLKPSTLLNTLPAVRRSNVCLSSWKDRRTWPLPRSIMEPVLEPDPGWKPVFDLVLWFFFSATISHDK